MFGFIERILSQTRTTKKLAEALGSKNKIFQEWLNHSTYKNIIPFVIVNVDNYPTKNIDTITTHFTEKIPIYTITREYEASPMEYPLDVCLDLVKTPVIVSTGEHGLFNILLSDHQKLIFIWHACGAFKRMGSVYTSGYKHRKPDYVIVSSESVRKHYAEAFEIDIDCVLALGIPRTESFQDHEYIENIKNNFFNKYPTLKNKKIYLHAPTYREFPWRSESGYNIKEIAELLTDDEVIIYKEHPAIINMIKQNKAYSEFVPVKDKIICMNQEDILELTIICSVIMTDYSSAFFEAMLLDKACVFVSQDIDKYERGFYLNYRNDLPGEIIESGKAQDVLKALRNASINHPNYQTFKKYHLESCVGNISERIATFIKQIQ
ncbi:MAG: CDP-glycerol glycerophosphotransferase family protein [Brevinema sp.]